VYDFEGEGSVVVSDDMSSGQDVVADAVRLVYVGSLPTATPINTPVPPTATPTDTQTPLPPTATPTDTQTPVPPTATPEPANTAKLRFEADVVAGVASSYVTVYLHNTYVSPVVFCSVNYANNSVPVISRVRNVTNTSFDVRLQNPGDGSPVEPETIHYLVMEEGAWTLPDGRPVEARRSTSAVTDGRTSWVGESQAYAAAYANPVVLGQVMTENDEEWSVFWSCGTDRKQPPSATALRVGKMLGEDANRERQNEELGLVVVEQGHGTVNGIGYEAALGPDTVRGVANTPPYRYSFSQSFTKTPAVALVVLSAMDGGNGGWAYLYGTSPLSSTNIGLAIDEDQIRDSERKHTTEQVTYLVFEEPTVYSGPS
jgi:hypothetical protein